MLGMTLRDDSIALDERERWLLALAMAWLDGMAVGTSQKTVLSLSCAALTVCNVRVSVFAWDGRETIQPSHVVSL